MSSMAISPFNPFHVSFVGVVTVFFFSFVAFDIYSLFIEISSNATLLRSDSIYAGCFWASCAQNKLYCKV